MPVSLYEASALQQLIDSYFPWLTKTFVRWRHLTLPVLLPVVMKSESRALRALISIFGRHSWGLVPHVPCPTVLSSMQGSLSICTFRCLSQSLCCCHCVRLCCGPPRCDSSCGAHCPGQMPLPKVSLLEPTEAIWACPGGRLLWLWLLGKSFHVLNF